MGTKSIIDTSLFEAFNNWVYIDYGTFKLNSTVSHILTYSIQNKRNIAYFLASRLSTGLFYDIVTNLKYLGKQDMFWNPFLAVNISVKQFKIHATLLRFMRISEKSFHFKVANGLFMISARFDNDIENMWDNYLNHVSPTLLTHSRGESASDSDRQSPLFIPLPANPIAIINKLSVSCFTCNVSGATKC